MPAAWSAGDERQYEAIKEKCLFRRHPRGGQATKASVKECERLAAATVNKRRAREGRALSGALGRTRDDPDALWKRFKASVNMSGAEIRKWAKDPRSKCYSQKATHDRLTKRHRYRGPGKPKARRAIPSLAELASRKSAPKDPEVLDYVSAVVAFNARHGKQAAAKCTEGRAVALRNWGHKKCALPKTCRRQKRKR